MRVIKNFLSIYLNKISAQDIIGENNWLKYRFSCSSTSDIYSTLLNIMDELEPMYSRNELRGQLTYLEDVCKARNRNWGLKKLYDDGIDLYDLMFYYASKVLTIQNDNISCKYKELLNWRMLTLELSEDMFICAYLADDDASKKKKRKIFDWPVVIGHNNTELNMILNEGMAENHFHLKGSAPMFHITWRKFMNGKLSQDDKKYLKLIEETSRKDMFEFSKHEHASLEQMIMQAAFIRVYLFSRLTEIDLICERKKTETLLSHIKECLSSDVSMGLYSYEMYGWINELRMMLLVSEGSPVLSDYAILEKDISGKYYSCEVSGTSPTNLPIYRGERHFMYLAFLDIREEHILTEEEKDLFYAYLVIKERFRHEMLQTNYKQAGFENFSIIEERKSYFVPGNDLVSEAMREIVFNSGIKYLEARIVPCDTAENNKKLIEKLDKSIDPEKKYKDYFGYIMHFIKSPDEENQSDERANNVCRHSELRSVIINKAEALIKLRTDYPAQGARVLAIDACNQEIGCRPEVFSCAFRKLKSHCVEEKNQNKRVPQLKLTYHVGEDFLDPLDGIRAIDEAINFLNMNCGDRLGHALALGIDIKEWYGMKGSITLPQQDFLDNIVWLYCALFEFNIKGFDNLKSYLEQEYEFFFNKIYRPYMDYNKLKNIIDAANIYYKEFSSVPYFSNDILNFDIYNYKKSCMLRGDDPSYYKNGYFKDILDTGHHRDPFKINYEYPNKFDYRLLPEVAILYYYYHFNNDVKKVGSRYIYRSLHPDYISAVDAVQKCMQKKIAQLGICIEANPTSNYLISTFKHYDKHPIIKWYNKSLETDPEKIATSPQISVSINTDDRGIFATKLSNEYSLMALALEKMKDENNNNKYDKTNIYRWIDDIRKFGLRQNFIYQNKLLCTEDEEEGEL